MAIRFVDPAADAVPDPNDWWSGEPTDLGQYQGRGRGFAPLNPLEAAQGTTIDTPPNMAGQTESIGRYDGRTAGVTPGDIPKNKSVTFLPGERIPGAAPMPPILSLLSKGGAGLAAALAAMATRSKPLNTGEFHPNYHPDISYGAGTGQTPFGGRPLGQPQPQPIEPTVWPDSTTYPRYTPPTYRPEDSPSFTSPNPYGAGMPRGSFPRGDPRVGEGAGVGPMSPNAVGYGQGPFAGRPAAPGSQPSLNAPMPPVRPKDQVAVQKPDLGYYGQTNLDPLGRGGRRLGGPLDAPQSTAIDLSKLFKRPEQ